MAGGSMYQPLRLACLYTCLLERMTVQEQLETLKRNMTEVNNIRSGDSVLCRTKRRTCRTATRQDGAGKWQR